MIPCSFGVDTDLFFQEKGCIMQDNGSVVMQELVRRSNEDARRLRALEQRLDSLESRVSSAENVNIDRTKKINTKFAELDVALKSTNDEMTKMLNNLDKINRQMVKFARKQDLREIEHMLELISPLRQEFVTRQDLKEEIEQEVKREVRLK